MMEETSDKKIIETEKKDNKPISHTNLNNLKESEPTKNIAVISKDSTDSTEVVHKITSSEKIKAVFNQEPFSRVDSASVKNVINSGNVSKERVESDIPAPLRQMPKSEIEKRRIGSATSSFVSEKINRNQSDIFSLKDETTIASSIFSVNGSPSRKVYRKVQKIPSSNVFPFGQVAEPPSEKATPRDRMRDKESYHDVKRPSSSLRNPLTGTGLNSNDEYKFKGNKKLDGNPLLGLGYSPETTSSTHRIPPGGYSHKLW